MTDDEMRFQAADGLTLRMTTRGDGEVFERFFAGYDKAFVLPNEKEDIDGFRVCLELNDGGAYKRLSRRYSDYREICLIAEDKGEQIGGANFIAAPYDARTVTANLNYLFIDERARRRGYLARLINAVRQAIAGMFPESDGARTLVFIEQNDPYRMSEEDYRRDTTFTGLDQFDRLRIWAKLGALVVDFPYRQPPLSADQEVDDTLVYSVFGAGAEGLDACVLEAHLRLFFGVSVLKGEDLKKTPDALEQVELLRKSCKAKGAVALLDPRSLLSRISSREGGFALWPQPPGSFREALRRALP